MRSIPAATSFPEPRDAALCRDMALAGVNAAGVTCTD